MSVVYIMIKKLKKSLQDMPNVMQSKWRAKLEAIHAEMLEEIRDEAEGKLPVWMVFCQNNAEFTHTRTLKCFWTRTRRMPLSNI